MTDIAPDHTPSPEFRAFLARDIVRTLRHDERFAPTRRAIRARRLGVVMASAVGTVVVLAIGLVLGAGTRLASAKEIGADQRPANLLSRISVRNALTVLTCAANPPVVAATPAAGGQQGVPIVDLPPATVKAPESFGTVLGVREVRGGKVLVNDGRRRVIRLYDSTLATATIVVDSAPGSSYSYGPYGMALIPYRGDSSLFAHFPSQTLLVLDGTGRIARVSAMPEPGATGSLIGARGGASDDRGRLIYKNSPSTMMMKSMDPATGMSRATVKGPPDSLEIFRADLDTRRIDTLGRVLQADGSRLAVAPAADGKGEIIKRIINPLVSFDEWAVLSDGTIALVRGHDYHVDWIHPDGTKSSTAKLPFDWKRLTDEDKEKLIDSARVAEVAAAVKAGLARAAANAANNASSGEVGGGGRGSARGGGEGGGGGGGGRASMPYDFAPLNQIADYYPAIRQGAATADLDGNLWVLPTTSAQSKHGELVYDVVNPRLGLFERVRVPEGRSIVGFGKGGVVYLLSGDRTNGFSLERTRLPVRPKAPPTK